MKRSVAVHGSTIVSRNGLVQRSRDVSEPFVLEVSRLCGEVLIVFPGHEASLIQYCKEALANVSKGFDDTRLNSLSPRGRVVT